MPFPCAVQLKTGHITSTSLRIPCPYTSNSSLSALSCSDTSSSFLTLLPRVLPLGECGNWFMCFVCGHNDCSHSPSSHAEKISLVLTKCGYILSLD
ncbi:hypothetical protein Pmani_036011 [Petrolisthes manimaculis]|uniref:Uncharacterized protein n=1 Tax=Petrolisthes manimaculis TaxID=1843537 RepID=A0AAE1NLU4_9EUCA|nr:hypothetical protein Pmani_036011 [Petrolisthes manimaculis]